MNITTREKVMLVALLIILICFLSFNFFIKPAMDSISQADSDIAAAQEQKNNLDIQAAVKGTLEEKNAQLDSDIAEVLTFFYPKLETKAVYKFVADSIASSGLTPALLNLSPVGLSYPETRDAQSVQQDSLFYSMAQQIAGNTASPDGTDVQSQKEPSDRSALPESRDIHISFSGEFRGLRELLSTLEEQDRSIIVTSFNFERAEGFEGSLSFTVYALPKPFEDSSGFPEYK